MDDGDKGNVAHYAGTKKSKQKNCFQKDNKISADNITILLVKIVFQRFKTQVNQRNEKVS